MSLHVLYKKTSKKLCNFQYGHHLVNNFSHFKIIVKSIKPINTNYILVNMGIIL